KLASHVRKSAQCLVEAELRITRDGHDADLVGRHRGDVQLAELAPVQLHVIGPRARAIVAAGSVAATPPPALFAGRPLPYARRSAIRADDPTRGHHGTIHFHAITADSLDVGAP